jgi:hypothetical protein
MGLVVLPQSSTQECLSYKKKKKKKKEEALLQLYNKNQENQQEKC